MKSNRLAGFWLLFFCCQSILAENSFVNWDSAEGIKRLERSDYKVDFFPLANHFESQSNKIYCGVAASVIVLNALRLDKMEKTLPLDESLLEQADRHYLPLGMNPIFNRYTQNNIFLADAKSKDEILGKPISIQSKYLQDYGLQLHQLADLLSKQGLTVQKRVVTTLVASAKQSMLQELVTNLKTPNNYILVNYLRSVLGQKGGGHISPLAAYDQLSDSFLIMDVNPNLSQWVWVKSDDLFAAMATFDVIENRGYLLIQEGK